MHLGSKFCCAGTTVFHVIRSKAIRLEFWHSMPKLIRTWVTSYIMSRATWCNVRATKTVKTLSCLYEGKHKHLGFTAPCNSHHSNAKQQESLCLVCGQEVFEKEFKSSVCLLLAKKKKKLNLLPDSWQNIAVYLSGQKLASY